MQKILIISPYRIFPPRNGGERRIYLLTKKLIKSHKVIFLGPKFKGNIDLNIDYYGVFKDKPIRKIFSISLIQKILQIYKKEKLEKIRLEFIWQGINLVILKMFTRLEYELDNHNVEFIKFKRMGSLLWPLIYIYEFLICKFAQKIICVSTIDKSYLEKYFKLQKSKIKIIKNPIDNLVFYPNSKNNNKIFKKLNIKKNEAFILFFGQLNYRPNTEAIGIIFKELLPRLKKIKNFKFKIVICGGGNIKAKYKDNQVAFTGFVGKIEDYINACDKVIVPLVSGSGTRIKILESLACNKKVISTSIGAEGLNQNKNLIIEDDWGKFCGHIVK